MIRFLFFRFNRTADLHFTQNSLVHILGNYVDYMHSSVHILRISQENMHNIVHILRLFPEYM